MCVSEGVHRKNVCVQGPTPPRGYLGVQPRQARLAPSRRTQTSPPTIPHLMAHQPPLPSAPGRGFVYTKRSGCLVTTFLFRDDLPSTTSWCGTSGRLCNECSRFRARHRLESLEGSLQDLLESYHCLPMSSPRPRWDTARTLFSSSGSSSLLSYEGQATVKRERVPLCPSEPIGTPGG